MEDECNSDERDCLDKFTIHGHAQKVSNILLTGQNQELQFSSFDMGINRTTNILEEENQGLHVTHDKVEKISAETAADDNATLNSLDPKQSPCVTFRACEESPQLFPSDCTSNTLAVEDTCYSPLFSKCDESASLLLRVINDRMDSCPFNFYEVYGKQLSPGVRHQNTPVSDNQDFNTNLDRSSQTSSEVNLSQTKMDKESIPHENGEAQFEQAFDTTVPFVPHVSSTVPASEDVTNLEQGFECLPQKEVNPYGLNSAAYPLCVNLDTAYSPDEDSYSRGLTSKLTSSEVTVSSEQTAVSLLPHNDENSDNQQAVSLTPGCSDKESSPVIDKNGFYGPVQSDPNVIFQVLAEKPVENISSGADENTLVLRGSEAIFKSNDQIPNLSVQVPALIIYPDSAKCNNNPDEEPCYPGLDTEAVSENGTTLHGGEEFLNPIDQGVTDPCPVYEEFTNRVDQQDTTSESNFICLKVPSPLPDSIEFSYPVPGHNRQCEVQSVECQKRLLPIEEKVINLVQLDKGSPSDQCPSSLDLVHEEATSPIPSVTDHHLPENNMPLPDHEESASLQAVSSNQTDQVRTTDDSVDLQCTVHDTQSTPASSDQDSGPNDSALSTGQDPNEDGTTLSEYYESSNVLPSEEYTISLTTVNENSSRSPSLVNKELIFVVPTGKERNKCHGDIPNGHGSCENHIDSDLFQCDDHPVATSVLPNPGMFALSKPLHKAAASSDSVNDISYSLKSCDSPSIISTPADGLDTFQHTSRCHFFVHCFMVRNDIIKVHGVRQFYKDIDAGHFGLNDDNSISFEKFSQNNAAVCESKDMNIVSPKYCELHFPNENGMTDITEEVDKDSFPFKQSVEIGLEPLITENLHDPVPTLPSTSEYCYNVKNMAEHDCVETLSRKDLSASGDDHYVTPSPCLPVDKYPDVFKTFEDYQSTPPISQSASSGSLHNSSLQMLKTSLWDENEPVPSKVRIIATDAEVYSSDQAVPDCEASNIACEPKSDTEPFYQGTIVPSRKGVNLQDLVQNSVFSWGRTDIIPDVRDVNSHVRKDSSNEGSLPVLLTLKTCTKPRRVGLSKRQKLPSLHHNVRKPSV